MTLADLTALISRVSKENPKLMDSREVCQFVQACVEEARKLPVGRAPIAPVDVSEV